MNKYLIFALICFMLLSFSLIYDQSQTIEIYTCENIYYLKGYHVTDEAGLIDLYFSSMKDLNTWLVERLTNELESHCKN
jgi:hypothetical protein